MQRFDGYDVTVVIATTSEKGQGDALVVLLTSWLNCLRCSYPGLRMWCPLRRGPLLLGHLNHLRCLGSFVHTSDSNVLPRFLEPFSAAYMQNFESMQASLAAMSKALAVARLGGGAKAVARHHARGKMCVCVCVLVLVCVWAYGRACGRHEVPLTSHTGVRVCTHTHMHHAPHPPQAAA